MARGLGVDVHFVATGTRTGKDWAYARAYSRLLFTIEMLLGLEENILEKRCKQRVELDEQANWFNETQDSNHPDNVSFAPWIDGVSKWLSSATKPDRCLDMELFARVLSSIETHARESGADLAPERKARAAVMLYRAAKSSGSVDRRMIEDAVKLAAS
ncbi:MAG: hypothetical protein IPG66_16815 [Hydrogenophilales bacterium]|nr:hypothetical protein [Hydrogenophilales bacterium]